MRDVNMGSEPPSGASGSNPLGLCRQEVNEPKTVVFDRQNLLSFAAIFADQILALTPPVSTRSG